MKKSILLFALITGMFSLATLAQENYKTLSKEDSARIYTGGIQYEVPTYDEPVSAGKPKNVILMIGDGMGLTQIHAGYTANGGKLFMANFKHLGFQTTNSATNYVTDSGAAGTALATGEKTYNGAIGVNTDTVAIQNIREKIEVMGKATGVVSTSAVTHATPASFVAHQSSRNYYEAIAADFLLTNIDVFIGGGLKHFTQRADGRDLTVDLKNKGYTLATTLEEVSTATEGKLAGLLAPEHLPSKPKGRGNELALSTRAALKLLSADPDGFFVMIEGSQIDWGGHDNNTTYIVTEVLDFDQAVGEALKFAAQDGETLLIVTSDHETGGMGINNGSLENGSLISGYTTGNHSAVMVPVMAFGPGAEQFQGFYDNTDIPKKIMALLKR
jgi:alkaline phosphatase